MIRSATRNDAEAIARLWGELVEYHRALDPDMPRAAPDGPRLYARRIADRLYDPQTCVLIAEENGRIVGYVLGVIMDLVPEMFAQEIAGFLADIYVTQDYRRHGIGRELVQNLRNWFRSRGVNTFEWYVATSNPEGHAFWKAVGGRDVMVRMRAEVGDEEE